VQLAVSTENTKGLPGELQLLLVGELQRVVPTGNTKRRWSG